MAEAANCWPTVEQSLLLKAALLEDEAQAKDCWARFCRAVDIQVVDYSTTSLTPLVYKRFRDLAGTEIQVAKSVYRHTWSSNNLSLHTLRKVLSLFAQAGIPVTLLKGAALIANVYRDPGLRVVGDMDILVPREQIEVAIKLLLNAGWRQLYQFDQRKFDVGHALAFVNPEGVNIDLHWRILGDAPFDQWFIDYQPEQRASLGLAASVLCPEDQLVHTLIHCHKYSPVPLIRWIPDASMVINRTPDFRWDYFFATVRKLHISYVVHKAVLHLHNEKYAVLAEPVLQQVCSLAWSQPEKHYFDFLTHPPNGAMYAYRYVWYLHTRNNPRADFLTLLYELPAYLKKSRAIDSNAKLFRYLAGHGFSHFKKRFRASV